MILLASAVLVVAAALLSAQLTPRGTVAWLLAFCLLAWSLCVVTVGIAGLVVRDLSGISLLALSIAWCLAAALVAWRRPSHARRRLRISVAAVRDAIAWPPAAAAALIVGVVLIWRIVLAVRVPVADVLGWQYHLVFVDVWLQADAIVRVPQNIWTDGWPATGELLTTWLSAFTRTDAFVGFTGFLPIPVAVVACIGLARSLGARPTTSLLAGLLLGMTPALLALSGTTYLDGAYTAAVLATWALGLRIVAGERDVSAALLFGIGAGLAFGIKPTSLVLVLPILLVVTLLILTRGPASIRSRLTQLAALGLPVLALGASWYLKNLFVHGNPFFPVGIGPFAGLEPGTYGAPIEPSALVGLSPLAKIAASWSHDWQLHEYIYNQRPGGLGHAWLAVVVLAVGGLFILVRRRAWWPLALIVAPTCLALAALASPWYARYTLFLPGLALPLSALVLDRFPRLPRLAAGFGLVVLASISVVLANAYPNVPIPLPPGADRAPAYWALVLGGSPGVAAGLDAPPRCRINDHQIPPGARVAVGRGFITPHAAVGPLGEHVLVQPPPVAADIETLVTELREARVGWLVAPLRSDLDDVASGAPDVFVPRGRLCLDGRVYEVRSPAG
jgi:hypothetical protein